MHNLEEMLRAVCQARLENKDFQAKKIMPLAQKHAQKLLATLLPQLEVLGFRALSYKAVKERTAELENILYKALILRAKVRASPDKYHVAWIEAGKMVDPATMEVLRQGEGPQEVAWCVTPSIEAKSGGKKDQGVACEAKVYSRPI